MNYFKNLNHQIHGKLQSHGKLRILTTGTNLILNLRNLQILKTRFRRNLQNLNLRDFKKPDGTMLGKISS